MTIVSTGLLRTAVLVASTFTYFGVGVGVTTVNVGDIELGSEVTPRQPLTNAIVVNNVVTLVGFLAPTQNNSASSITEIGVFDASSAGNLCFRTVASTNTWTSFTKNSSTAVLISADLTVST